MHIRRWSWLVPAALAASLATTAPARSQTKGCGPRGYAYAGVQAHRSAYGVSATLAATSNASVQRGHVAGWIGVGAPGQGPNGSSEWLQVGLNQLNGSGVNLYYEIAQPWGVRYFPLESNVRVGRQYSVAVLEIAGRRNVWRVWVDNHPASPPIWLPASHGALTPMAMAESWDGGAPACNRYAYRFGEVALAGSPGGWWKRFRLRDGYVVHDPGYRVVPALSGGFVAAAAPVTPAGSPDQPSQLPDRRPRGLTASAPARTRRR